MPTATGNELPDKALTQRPPGFLSEPFGSLSEWLVRKIESEPSLVTDVLRIGRKRMHLIALAFAHFDGESPPWSQSTNAGHLLFRGSAAEILDMTLGRRPRGLKRTLDRMPPRVLQPESYLRLLDLLEEPAAAKALSHSDSINDSSLKALADTPVALRPVIFTIDSSSSLNGLADGLRFLVARGAAPSFEALITDLQSLRQPAQRRPAPPATLALPPALN
jgi:hypothetical protein